MPNPNSYRECDRCGFKFKYNELKRQKGLLVCNPCIDGPDPISRVNWGFYGKEAHGDKTVQSFTDDVVYIQPVEHHVLITALIAARAVIAPGIKQGQLLTVEGKAGTQNISFSILDPNNSAIYVKTPGLDHYGTFFKALKSASVNYIWALRYTPAACSYTETLGINTYDALTELPNETVNTFVAETASISFSGPIPKGTYEWVRGQLTSPYSIVAGNYYGIGGAAGLIPYSMNAAIKRTTKGYCYYPAPPWGWLSDTDYEFAYYLTETDNVDEAPIIGPYNTGYILQGNKPFMLGDGDIIQFVWDTTKSKWVETSRSYYYEHKIQGRYV